MRTFVFVLALLLAPTFVEAQDLNDVKCVGPFSIACADPPCFPLGANGKDFGAWSNYYWINVNLTAGDISLDVEGTARKGVFGTVGGPYTSGVNGFLTATPPVLRPVVNDCVACTGTMVICGNR